MEHCYYVKKNEVKSMVTNRSVEKAVIAPEEAKIAQDENLTNDEKIQALAKIQI